jgi:acetyl esterase
MEMARQLRAGARPPQLPPETDDLEVADKTAPGPHGDVRLRVYRPTKTQPTGVLVNLHGGGWAMGSIDHDDWRCRRLQRETGATVVSVGYRLAPEHPFPIPFDDCYAGLLWAWDHRAELAGPDSRIVLEGSSAGGNLAAAVAIKARDEGVVPLALQVLISPVCDCDFETASYIDNGTDYFLTRAVMRWYWDQYTPGEARYDPYAAPLRRQDLRGVAPAHIVVAEYDPLRDEGLAYAQKLADAGVPVKSRCYPGTIHSFTSMAPASDIAKEAFDSIAEDVRRALAG